MDVTVAVGVPVKEGVRDDVLLLVYVVDGVPVPVRELLGVPVALLDGVGGVGDTEGEIMGLPSLVQKESWYRLH